MDVILFRAGLILFVGLPMMILYLRARRFHESPNKVLALRLGVWLAWGIVATLTWTTELSYEDWLNGLLLGLSFAILLGTSIDQVAYRNGRKLEKYQGRSR
jgi:hypothetical protein